MVTNHLELDPRVNVNMVTSTSQQVPARASTTSKRTPAANVKASSAQDRPSTKPRSVNDRRASSVHSQSTRKAQNKSRRGSVQPGSIGNPGSHGHQFQHPFLTKSTLFTYKGRVLEQSMGQDGEVIYVDRAAVFVGRIAKGVETQNTLLQRFARYGKVVSNSPAFRLLESAADLMYRSMLSTIPTTSTPRTQLVESSTSLKNRLSSPSDTR